MIISSEVIASKKLWIFQLFPYDCITLYNNGNYGSCRVWKYFTYRSPVNIEMQELTRCLLQESRDGKSFWVDNRFIFLNIKKKLFRNDLKSLSAHGESMHAQCTCTLYIVQCVMCIIGCGVFFSFFQAHAS